MQPVCGCAPVELMEAAREELLRDRAEGIRVAYVAATRARDLLAAPVCGDKCLEGWLQVLNPMLYPQSDMRRKSVAAPGCPTFGEDSVSNRGPEGHSPPEGTVRWFAPDIARRPGCGVVGSCRASIRGRRTRAATASTRAGLDTDGAAATSEANYRLWSEQRGRTLSQASRPSIKVQTVTSLARRESEEVSDSGPKTTSRPPHVRVEFGCPHWLAAPGRKAIRSACARRPRIDRLQGR